MTKDQTKIELTDFQTEYEVRLKKREQILADSKEPYPARIGKNQRINDCLENFDKWEKAESRLKELQEAVDKHKEYMWGEDVVDHSADKELYRTKNEI